jgi:hypothetical protein
MKGDFCIMGKNFVKLLSQPSNYFVREGYDLCVSQRFGLISGAEVLDEGRYDLELLLRFEESRVGHGVCRLQVVGVYADGMEVVSEPLVLRVFNSLNE